MTKTLFEQLSVDEKNQLNNLNYKIKSGILNYNFNSINELRKCICLGYFPNKIANFVYENYRYDIVNCKNIDRLKAYCESAIIEMKKVAQNKKELNYTKKGEYGPNALKNCVQKNNSLQNYEKVLLYNYIDTISQ